MGNDSIIAFRTRELLRKHLGIFSPQFKWNRWKMGFLGQMLFGIQASWDTLMSEIARSLQESLLAKKTQERLERHLAMDAKIHGSILCDAAPGKVQAKKGFGFMRMQCRNMYEGKYICRNSHSQNRAIPKLKFEIARLYGI